MRSERVLTSLASPLDSVLGEAFNAARFPELRVYM